MSRTQVMTCLFRALQRPCVREGGGRGSGIAVLISVWRWRVMAGDEAQGVALTACALVAAGEE
ncbi:hypothetical protein E2C01_053082 [Portunus trituberculatus]|uniref:Uncharacterized protein n=1 Tax=Portunus trituberculatus TaxID=210409 RepID=A0A5B7GNH1_PORTR|nr:hypothetical protein [Portunus trituberculatus]